MSEEPHLLVDVVEDNILVATFNRPDKLNAMSAELMRTLEEAVLRYRDTPELRVMLIKGHRAGYLPAAGKVHAHDVPLIRMTLDVVRTGEMGRGPATRRSHFTPSSSA